MIEVDARGLSCPQPVLETKKAFEKSPGEVIAVLVDEAVAKENVSRFAGSSGYSVEAAAEGDGYRLTMTPDVK